MRFTTSLARTALHTFGGIRGFRFWNRHAVRILMYHRFSPHVEGLRHQCEHIRRYYRPVSLQGIADHLKGAEPLPPNALAVTVDDGYRDFLFLAQPIFREYEIPVTVYLVSDFLDGKSWLWWDLIEYLMRRTAKSYLAMELPTGELLNVPLQTEEQRRRASLRVAEALKRVANSERLRLLDSLPRLLNVEVPRIPPPEWEPLSWDEVRTLSREGVEFGAHTKTHPILSCIQPEEQREEIEGSKRRLEEELGRSVVHFCYPNGRRSDFNDVTLRLLTEFDFRSATTAEPGMNQRRADPLALRRLGAGPVLTREYFRELLAGVRSD